MIAPFIIRDFKTFKMAWLFIVLFSLAAIPLRSHSFVLSFLTMSYFLFACVPISQIVGAKNRSQHVMSRNYLLALPINRKRNFLYLIVRIQIFLVPLILLAASLLVFFVAKYRTASGPTTVVYFCLFHWALSGSRALQSTCIYRLKPSQAILARAKE